MESPNRQSAILETLRRYLTFILLLELLGTSTELLLVGHYEERWQWVPLALIALALLVLGRLAAAPSAASVRAWQGLMVLFMLGGVAGLALHWNAKMEFKREADPSLAGLQLFREAMKTQSPPALAPGAMIQMGLLGPACAYRYPALAPAADPHSKGKGEYG